MRKPLKSLIRVSLKNNFSIVSLRYKLKHQDNRRGELIASLIAIAIAFASLIFMYIFILVGMYRQGVATEQPELIVAFGFTTTQFFTLFFGIIYIMSVFYFSKDFSILIPMPLTPSEVMLSKFIAVLANEYLVVLPMLLPPILIYGINRDVSLFYWVKSLAFIAFAPIIPLTMAAILVMVIMRFINLSRHKDTLTIIGGLLSILFVVVMSIYSQDMTGMDEELFLETQINFIEEIGKKFPPSIWATIGLVNDKMQGILNLLLFIGVSILFFMGLIFLSERVFYEGLLAGMEAGKKRHTANMRIKVKRRSPLSALVLREWRLFIRNPGYAINGLAGIIIMPLIIIISFSANGKDMEEFISLMQLPGADMAITIVGIFLSIFTSTTNMISCTAISREGKDVWISKLIPVSPKKQVLSKLFHAMIVSTMGIVSIGIIYAIFLKLSLGRTLIILSISFLASLFMNIIGLIVDIMNPKLDWTNPQEAYKSNINGLFGLLSVFIVMGILGALTYILMAMGEFVIYSGMSVLLIVLSILSLKYLFKRVEISYIDD